jgi:hypothetical protein
MLEISTLCNILTMRLIEYIPLFSPYIYTHRVLGLLQKQSEIPRNNCISLIFSLYSFLFRFFFTFPTQWEMAAPPAAAPAFII